MKQKKTKQVIRDLYKLFKLNKRCEKNSCICDENFVIPKSYVFDGLFMIGKDHIKTSKARKILEDYFEKIEISDGVCKVVKKTPGYFKFKVLNYESEKKKRQRQKQARKTIKAAKAKKNKGIK